MTHLVIEQNGTEAVPKATIDTLDNLTRGGQVDNSSNLKGILTTSMSYKDTIDRLTDRFQQLSILAGVTLAYFVDSYEEAAVAELVGNSSGYVTIQEADLINDVFDSNSPQYAYSVYNNWNGRFIQKVFTNNNIQTLDLTPFRYVTGIWDWGNTLRLPSLITLNGGNLKFTSYWDTSGSGGNQRAIARRDTCLDLTYFTFPKAEIVGSHCFYGNQNLQYAFFAKAQYMLGYHLRWNDSLKMIYFGQDIKYVSTVIPDWDYDPSNTIKIVFNKVVSDVSECPKAFSSCTVPAADTYKANGTDINYFESNSSFTTTSSLDTGTRKWGKIDVYVPDECVSIYQQSVWNQVGVYGISTLSTDEKNAIRDYAHENDPIFV